MTFHAANTLACYARTAGEMKIRMREFRTSVGMTLDDIDPEPLTVFPVSRAIDLGASWIYVIGPVDDTVTVHAGDGESVGVRCLLYVRTGGRIVSGRTPRLVRHRVTRVYPRAARPRPARHRGPGPRRPG
jgi:hypothetical protein